MIATTVLPSPKLRVSSVAIVLVQKFLMVAGLVFILGFIAVQSGHSLLIEELRSWLPDQEVSEALDTEAGDADVGADPAVSPQRLSPRMRGALDYVARRYRVSTEALQPIFSAAQVAGREHRIDPLLIVAVIGVESGFNPFSQSVFGAQGLMQVVPRFHLDKLPEEADRSAFLDPVTNVQIGVKVLKESIRRYGSVEDGLQQFGGAVSDPERRYASKVMAEKQRLEQAAQRLRTT